MRYSKLPSAVTVEIAPLAAAVLQLLQRGIEVVDAVEVLGQPVVADQAGGGELVLVVVEDDRVRIERHGILLAVDVHRVPGRRGEASAESPIAFMSSSVISVSVPWLTPAECARRDRS